MNHIVEIDCDSIDLNRVARWLQEINCLNDIDWVYHMYRVEYDHWVYTFMFRYAEHATAFALRWS
jgi:hypothetical protein